MTGKMVIQSDQNMTINLSLLPNGEYIIVFQTIDNKTVSKKIIKN